MRGGRDAGQQQRQLTAITTTATATTAIIVLLIITPPRPSSEYLSDVEKLGVTSPAASTTAPAPIADGGKKPRRGRSFGGGRRGGWPAESRVSGGTVKHV